jgi:hypothetical protein
LVSFNVTAEVAGSFDFKTGGERKRTKIEMEASGGASVSSSSGAKAMQDLLEGHKEWSRAVVYDQDGKVLASTFDVDLNDIECVFRLHRN